MTAHVFISYSRADQAYVDRLAEYITRAGIQVWYDYAVEAGDSFGPRIQQAIDECVAFVVVLTPHSASSEWVRREISRADRNKKPMLPLLLRECDTPIELDGKQHEDVTQGQMPSYRFIDGLSQLTANPYGYGRESVPAEPQPRPQSQPRPRRRRRGRAALLGISALALLLVGGALLANQQGWLHVPIASDPGNPRDQAAAVNELLESSGASKANLTTALTDLGNCVNTGAALTLLTQVTSTRSGQLEQAKRLRFDALPNGSYLHDSLIEALSQSLAADQAFTVWARNAPNIGCAYDTNHDEAIAASEDAQQAKRSFVELWNPIADEYGLPRRDAPAI